jgi:hypothetical protein
MANISLAYTAPINPPSADITLTESQVWTGLKRKVKRPYEFVPVITAASVISEEGDTVVREATFAAGTRGPSATTVREVCVHKAPSRVDFQQEDGSTISNIVSTGPDGELLMTYSFEWKDQKLAEGQTEEELRAQYRQVGFHFTFFCSSFFFFFFFFFFPVPVLKQVCNGFGLTSLIRAPRWPLRAASTPSDAWSRRARFSEGAAIMKKSVRKIGGFQVLGPHGRGQLSIKQYQ